MPTMDECRRKAEECLRWADEAANDQQRETLLEIARLWTQLELSSTKWCGRGCSGLKGSRGAIIAQAPRKQGRAWLQGIPGDLRRAILAADRR